jgi:hypothetical protein
MIISVSMKEGECRCFLHRGRDLSLPLNFKTDLKDEKLHVDGSSNKHVERKITGAWIYA